jgi:uncharacterized protein YnzC (UPF0291/DUF896 family)
MSKAFDEFMERYNKLKEKEKLGTLTKEEAETLEFLQYKLDDWRSDGVYSY